MNLNTLLTWVVTYKKFLCFYVIVSKIISCSSVYVKCWFHFVIWYKCKQAHRMRFWMLLIVVKQCIRWRCWSTTIYPKFMKNNKFGNYGEIPTPEILDNPKTLLLSRCHALFHFYFSPYSTPIERKGLVVLSYVRLIILSA